jgi:enamine deaminase RidA (YjgF/YER057c/UK114 family)
MTQADIVNREIQSFFGDDGAPPVSHVEWIGGNPPIEIELIAAAPHASADESVTYSTPSWMITSPIYSKVARIHGDRRLYTSGLVSSKEGDGAAQVRDIFQGLEGLLAETGSDIRHLAKATYYVADDDVSKQLNAIRPEFYDPKRPPAASKAMVKGTGVEKRSITIDLIGAPSSSR